MRIERESTDRQLKPPLGHANARAHAPTKLEPIGLDAVAKDHAIIELRGQLERLTGLDPALGERGAGGPGSGRGPAGLSRKDHFPRR